MAKRGNGEGTIVRLKNGRWRADVTFGFDPQTGKQVRRSKTAPTRREAARFLKELLAEKEQGVGAGGATQSVTAYLDSWLITKASSIRPRTLDSYKQVLRLHVLPVFGHRRLTEVRVFDIQRLLDRVATKAGHRTANYVRTVLHGAFSQAVSWQILGRNPVVGTVPKSVQPRAQTIWTPEQIRTFLSVARAHRLYALFYVLFTTGLRLGEIIGLTWADVGPDTISVRRTVGTRTGRIVESEPKTASGRRIVAIDPETYRVLDTHRVSQRGELRSLGIPDSSPAERVFTTRLGGTLDERNLRQIWYRLQDCAGVPRARLHDARHMHISMLIGQGVDIRTVADRAGHADAVLTLRLYSHALEAQKRRSALPLEVLLGTPAEPV